MTTQSIPLFKAIGAKMDFLNQRQRILSQNIANADTPNYKPQDLKPVDFGQVLEKVIDDHNIRIKTTNSKHMPTPDAIEHTQEKKQKKTYEVAPAGNAVIMEEQLIQANKTQLDYNLMTSLYQKNAQMIRTALGR